MADDPRTDPIEAGEDAVRYHLASVELNPATCGTCALSPGDGEPRQRHLRAVAIMGSKFAHIVTYQREAAQLRALMQCEETGHAYVFGDPVVPDGQCERCPAHVRDDANWTRVIHG